MRHVSAAFLLLNAAFRARAANITIPLSVPSDAEDLPPTHLSFSLEQDRWPDWSGRDTRNEFTYTALTNLQQFTGVPPKIRVGANTEDRTTWSPTVTIVEDEFPSPNTLTPYPEATRVTVNDDYYALSKWMPAGTIMTWGVNFGQDNATNAINMARSILKAFDSHHVKAAGVTLEMVEVGNEPDLYRNNGLRPSGWTQEQYVADWINIAGAVVNATNITGGNGIRLLAASFAGQGYTPTGIFNDGLLDSPPGKVVKAVSQHRYSGAFCSGGDFALSSFMNKASVRTNLSVFSADVVAVKSRGLQYILGETGSIACHGAPGVSNTAGAALWTIDYTLQAAVLGMSEVFFHEGIGFKYNFFQPIALNRSIIDGTPLNPPQPPHVMPSYYAAILIARSIARTGSARIIELPISEDNVSGYAIYEHGNLARAIFINLNAWLVSSTGTRPSVQLSLGISGKFTPKVVLGRRLVIGHADDTEGLLLAGQTYETVDGRAGGREKLEVIPLAEEVSLRATEAILLEFI